MFLNIIKVRSKHIEYILYLYFLIKNVKAILFLLMQIDEWAKCFLCVYIFFPILLHVPLNLFLLFLFLAHEKFTEEWFKIFFLFNCRIFCMKKNKTENWNEKCFSKLFHYDIIGRTRRKSSLSWKLKVYVDFFFLFRLK